MRFLICVYFLFGFLRAPAQNITFKGKIVNAETQHPVPYANIVMLSQKNGTSSDKNGYFELTVNEGDLETFVRISSLGYKNKALKVNLLQKATIFLNPKVSSLDEVMLYTVKDLRHRTLNPFKGKDYVGLGNFSGGSYPSALARYYKKPSSFEKECFLKSVVIFFYSGQLKQSEMPAKFRLRILSVKPDGSPGDDLLAKNLILNKPEGRFRMKMDLLNYKIVIPKNGFFVAVEHLFIPYNQFVETKTFKINDTLIYENVRLVKYAPIFRGVLEKNNSDFKSYYQSNSGWKKMNNLDSSSPLLEGKIPSPAFRVIISN